MRIESIEWRNFTSYGNKLQKISFDTTTGNFFLVVGGNGSGKSSISEIIQFALYGKVTNKRIGDIVNRFNNNLQVRIVLWKDKKTKIIIDRGLSPSHLKLSINNKEYDQAGKKNINNYIEDDIIQIPFYVFNNIISLSINDFKSFLNMSANDKRMIIDKIFNLDIINNIKILVRDEIRNIKNNIYLIDKELELLSGQIDTANLELERIKNLNLLNEKTNKENIQKEILTLKEQQNKIRDEITEISKKELKFTDRLNQIQLKRQTAVVEYNNFKKQHTLLSLDKCPTCEQSFNTESIHTLLNDVIKKEQERSAYIKRTDDAIIDIKAIKKKIYAIKKKAERTEANITFNLSDLRTQENERNKSKKTSLETNYINKTIDKLNETKDTKNVAKDTNIHQENFLHNVEQVYGDNGIKQLALQRIVPSLNIEIDSILSKMHLQYKVIFDSNFEPTIRHLGYNVTQHQLSTGERKKIDFAILISLLRLLKIKNPNMNLFFLDEIFASLDTDSVHHVLQILSEISTDLFINIFVINHTILPSELFDYKITVQKTNNFSDIELTKID